MSRQKSSLVGRVGVVMEYQVLAFWLQFGLISFAVLLMVLLFFLGQGQKRRIEKKIDQIFVEVRDLNLRVTVLETRMEERSMISLAPQQTRKEVTTPVKRGRPRKVVE